MVIWQIFRNEKAGKSVILSLLISETCAAITTAAPRLGAAGSGDISENLAYLAGASAAGAAGASAAGAAGAAGFSAGLLKLAGAVCSCAGALTREAS